MKIDGLLKGELEEFEEIVTEEIENVISNFEILEKELDNGNLTITFIVQGGFIEVRVKMKK
jgi:hypothetical protein